MAGLELSLPDPFAHGGEMGKLMRAKDWSSTPLGPVAAWPQSLKTSVSICLASRFPMLIWWGPQLVMLYNDAYQPFLYDKHPKSMGQPGQECWAEIWDIIGPMLESVMERGEATWSEDQMLPIERRGFVEELYFTFSYSPILEEEARIGGVFTAVFETTGRIIGERRLRALKAVADATVAAKNVLQASQFANEALAEFASDLPVVQFYGAMDSGLTLVAGQGAHEADTDRLRKLVAAIGADDRLPAPGEMVALPELRDMRIVATKPWPEPLTEGVLLAVPSASSESAAAYMLVGISPRLEFDDDYARFLTLLAGQVGTAIANAEAYEAERRRAEALAEIDRAKTTFFSNVSHEFRTPLTLMLGPLDDALSAATLGEREQALVRVARRNGDRLLKLVNSLLEFSRIEAGRMQASYAQTDVAAYTAELASAFRSAVERSGMRLIINCEPIEGPVYVDQDMWERIVLNLISNAFKYTLDGEIEVATRRADDRFVLTVRDTGVGIREEELPNLFNRFYRIEGSRGRTQEGSGIGLALVNELVKLHGGRVGITSVYGDGTTVSVEIPVGSSHLPPDRISVSRTLAPTSLGAAPYVEEALRWLPEANDLPSPIDAIPHLDGTERPRLVVADDNADMREYLSRLLSSHYDVTAVARGEDALSLLRSGDADALLTDVMMPGMDGFELLRAVRSDERTSSLPVVMLSARAGEEARVDGLAAGADDYLVKPFSSRELLSRLASSIALARMRNEAAERILESERRFWHMADNAPVMVWVTDASGECTFLSRSWYEHTGQTPEEALGNGWLDAIHPDDRERTWLIFADANRRQSAFRVEYRLRTASGEHRWSMGGASPHVNASGEFQGYVGSVVDITEQKDAEAELRRSIELKDELLGLVSHEFRTPLTTITGYIDILSRRFDELTPEMREQALSELRRDGERLRRLIENMLIIARGERPNERDLEPIALHRLLPEIVGAINLRDPERPAVLDCPASLPPVLASRGYVEQVIENLVTNARKYGSTSGPIAIAALAGLSAVTVIVSNPGEVLDADEVSEFFEPFYRSAKYANRSGGAGLGLAVCARLVDMMGGQISAEPNLEGGLSVKFTLPFARDETSWAAEDENEKVAKSALVT